MNVNIKRVEPEKILYQNVPPGTFFDHGGTVYLKIYGNANFITANFTTSYRGLEIGSLLHITVRREPSLGTFPLGTMVTILPKESVTITN